MLTASTSLIGACAKGTPITDTEIVYLSLQPASDVDAGADSGSEATDPTGASAVDNTPH